MAHMIAERCLHELFLTVAPGRPGPTEADSEMTIVLPAGREATVVLGPSGMVMPWDRPVAQGGAVVRVSASGGYPSSLPARAVFKAVRPGTAPVSRRGRHRA
jgi:hypothetical protein